ncbi:MAG TPA: phosphoglucosamine mutase, partial [Proteobacteria bacterium]|nr:phosphoglucosamine mutase [Pseudomonadota bacterium]
MGRLFGTDGVRGTANSGALTPEMAVMLGRASAYVLASKRGIQRPRVVIGKDTRISG